MASASPAAEELPFYVRWSPELSRFAIELKLDLIPKITAELNQAERSNVEVGGVLLGSVLSGKIPILRIEAIQMLPRSTDGDAIYILGPEDQAKFGEVRRAARAQHHTAIGFFRSHCRPGPLKPSMADRSLLAAEFKSSPHTLLLIEASAPRTAAFFVAANGELPPQASVREFRFNEGEFRALPEVEADPEEAGAPPATLPALSRNRYIWAAAAGMLIVAIALWVAAGRGAMPEWLATGSPRLGLTVSPSDHLLRISWSHDLSKIKPASTAILTIADGSSRREIKLGPDELRLGSLEYDGAGRQVEVDMTLNPDGATGRATPLNESVKWIPK
ncbi:MAG: hypothetical protein JO340_14075 [Acidobacteriaceae bacterium]|nr:hypothetical protein [Acidobacteriaceae bacterium]